MSNELVVSGIMPVQEIKAQVQAIQEIMKGVLIKDTHYGVVPGCGDKPTLLKAGAEKLAMAFRLDLQTEVEIIEHGGEHREYRCMTTVYSKGSSVRLGNGSGCASTQETKWKYRSENTGAEVPKEYWDTRDSALLGGSQFSTRKVDGKWFIFHKVEHDNPADYYNTCLKMAEKRSKVCAVLNVTAASDIFTQDIEDMAQGTVGAKKSANNSTDKAYVQEGNKANGKKEEVITRIASVTQKKGGSESNPWTKFTIHSVGDTKYTTFDKAFAEIATDTIKQEEECLILFKYNSEYRSNEIESISIVKEAAPVPA